MSTETNPDFRDPAIIRKEIDEDDRYWKDLTPKERDQIEFKFRRALMQLVIRFPFFGFMATRLANDKVWIKSEQQLKNYGKFKTMATDGKRIYIWPQYVLYNDVQSTMGTIMHELLHVMLLHISRGVGYNQELANVAMDYVVNMMVNDFAREIAGRRRNDILDENTYRAMPWYVATPPGYYDERFRDPKTGDPMMWEQVYNIILKEQNPETQKRLNQGAGISDATDGQGLQGSGGNGSMHDSHDFWNPNKRPSDEDGNTNTDKFDPAGAREMVREAHVQATQSKMRGKLPGSMERLINEWLHPPLPWQRLVQNYLKPAQGDYGYVPGDYRFEEPIPWFQPEHQLRYIIVSIDTSGSMSDQEVGSAISQARHLLKGFPNVKGILCQCDAEVSYWDDIKEVYKIDRRSGNGGTSFLPPFQKIIDEGLINEVDLHIYFTDGYGYFPDEHWLKDKKVPFDTLWVITNNDVQVPEGRQNKWTRLNPLVAVER